MPKCIFTKDLLYAILKRDGATLVGECDVLTRRTTCTIKCQCGKTADRLIGVIKNHGARCRNCANKTAIQTLSIYREEAQRKALIVKRNPNREGFYTMKTLQQIILKCNAILVGTYDQLVCNSSIYFTCKCGKTGCSKNFIGIVGNSKSERETPIGAYCDKCINENMVEKRNVTNMQLYQKKGGINQENMVEKTIQTCLAKYGVPSSNQVSSVKQKKIETCLKNWGVENPTQNQEVMERTQKNAKKYKEFKMPSGNIRMVMGYEPFAITDLLKIYTEDQIRTDRKDIPRIQYEVDGKKKYYFPDIFIPHQNKIIEVKSTWTYKCKTDNVLLKKKACEGQGYIYEIWC